MSEPVATIFRAAAIRDASPGPSGPVNLRPGAIAVRQGRIVAVGEPDAVEKDVKQQGPWRLVEMPDRLILPAMVNAHAHLDLTDLGRMSFDDVGRDFIRWVDHVVTRRPWGGLVVPAVRNGLRMSREAGVGPIGDIAGCDESVTARIEAGEEWSDGPSFLECFGFGIRGLSAGQDAVERVRALARAARARRGDRAMVVGIQPHAPYSAGPDLFRAACSIPVPRSIHLAETIEETTFVHDGKGPFVGLLQRFGKWDEEFRGGTGLTPVNYLSPHAWQSAWTVAHCNYVTDDDIEIMSRSKMSVAYCPIASEYFGHRGHRYRELLEAGVNVCLGTDSIICQPADAPQPLGILPQMRRLYRRDTFAPAALLAMATIRGWRAIGVPGKYNELGGVAAGTPGKIRIFGVRIDPTDPTDALVQALLNDNAAEPISIPL